MFAILATCRLFGWLVRKWLRQPQVIGEMIAGVVLGPSLLGLVAQLGIGLYMFLVGLQAGIIGAPLFSMLVLMAIVTTLMASPLFEWVYGRQARARGELAGLQ